jgi:flavodoxin
MYAVVVYESMFGNTRDIAESIAEGLADGGIGVRCIEVSEAPRIFDHPDLLVVGGPTHAFSMSRAGTRDSARNETDAPLVSSIGIRDWLADVEIARGQPFCTFDTKVPKPRLPGSAAASAARRLKTAQGSMVASPETYWVADMTGPLQGGEIERARSWGNGLASRIVEAAATDQRKRA